MPTQVLVDCITIESSGENYQQWKENIAISVKQQQENRKIVVNNENNNTELLQSQ